MKTIKLLKISMFMFLAFLSTHVSAYDFTIIGNDYITNDDKATFSTNSWLVLYEYNSTNYVTDKKVWYIKEWTQKVLNSTEFWYFSASWSIDITYVDNDTANCDWKQKWTLSWKLNSTYWWDLEIKSWNYYCPNTWTIDITLYSDSLWTLNLNWEATRDTLQATIVAVSWLISSKNTDSLKAVRWLDWKSTTSVTYSQVWWAMFQLNSTIDKNIITLTNGLTPNKTDTTLSDFTKNVMYYDFSWKSENSESSENNKWEILNITASNVSWEKTLIVQWWNVYIKQNIVNNDKNSVLTIVVKRDKNNLDNWWNVYIDPSVTNIDALIIADWSIMSYNWYYRLNTNSNSTNLKNQLLIYWLIATKNTLTYEDPKSPYWSDWYRKYGKNSDIDAQYYSLAYLRSYMSNSNWTSNGNEAYPRTTTKTNPLVIEYNPIVQTNTPKILLNSY